MVIIKLYLLRRCSESTLTFVRFRQDQNFIYYLSAAIKTGNFNKFQSGSYRKMRRPRVLVTHREVPEEAINMLKEKCEVILCPHEPLPTMEEIIETAKDLNAIFWCCIHQLDERILNAAGPSLKIISTLSTGYDHLNAPLLKSRGIKLGNIPTVPNKTVADFAIMLALAAARRLIESLDYVKQDRLWYFSPMRSCGQDLWGSTIGILGFGGIGQEIAKRCKGFEVARIVYHGPSIKPEAKEFGADFVDFETLLKVSDFLFLACPLNPQTRGLFDKKVFEKMKKTSVLVNVARGLIVNQDDLIEALENGTIFAAGLDVMTPEPLPKGHKLTTLPNCVVAPHIATGSYKTKIEMATLCARNILNALEGKPMISQVC